MALTTILLRRIALSFGVNVVVLGVAFLALRRVFSISPLSLLASLLWLGLIEASLTLCSLISFQVSLNSPPTVLSGACRLVSCGLISLWISFSMKFASNDFLNLSAFIFSAQSLLSLDRGALKGQNAIVLPTAPPSLWQFLKANSMYSIGHAAAPTLSLAFKIVVLAIIFGNLLTLSSSWPYAALSSFAVLANEATRVLANCFFIFFMVILSHSNFELIMLHPIDFQILQPSPHEKSLIEAICLGEFSPPRKHSILEGTSTPTNQNLAPGRFAIQYWKDAIFIQQEFIFKLMNNIKPVWYGIPYVPVLSKYKQSTNILQYQLDQILRLLALQDIARLSRASASRRMDIIKNRENWTSLIFSLCAFMDITSLQLQLIMETVFEEIFAVKSTNSFEYLPKHLLSMGQSPMNNHFVGGIRNLDNSFKENLSTNPNSDEASFAARDIIKEGRKSRDSFFKSYGLLQVHDYLSTQLSLLLGRNVKSGGLSLSGIDKLDPLGYSVTQMIIFVMQSISYLITNALQEDNNGCTSVFVPVILNSLLSLHLMIDEYSSLINRYYLIFPRYKASLTSAKSQRRYGSFPKEHIRNTAMSANLIALSVSVDENINRLLRAYRDQLSTFSFPQSYVTLLETKLKSL